MFSTILGYKVFNGTKKEFLDYIEKYDKVNIISGNPEVLSNGLKNKVLFDNFTQSTSIIIPDGIGTVISSKIVGEPVKEKIAGIEVMDSIIKKYYERPIYLLGTKQEILDTCIKNIKLKYPKVNIVGSHDGYFDINNCDDIVKDIEDKKAEILFIAMGAPKQEIFITKFMDKLPCKIFMGVGGSFDVIAGKVKRAPNWMINLGLEWLYRAVKQPERIKRLGVIPKFLIKVATKKR